MFHLHTWTPQDGGPPAKAPVQSFQNEKDAVEAFDSRNPADLVILYKDGQKSAVRHSARKA